jgi:hypothetical protein
VNAEKTESCHQNAGHSHILWIANKSFENVVDFKYWGMKVKVFMKKFKNTLSLDNASYCSVQNLLSLSLPKKLKIKSAKL